MPRIAISYRRADTAGITGRIYVRLTAHFGEGSVFMDLDAIPLGVDFPNYVEAELRKTDFLLVIIGSRWSGPLTNGAHRIDEAGDQVRMEVATGLSNGTTTVIPLLIDSAQIPPADALPEELRGLPRINGFEISSGRDFQSQVMRLIRYIDDGITSHSGSAHPNNLPAHISSFVGRKDDVQRLGELVREHRVVTIAGPGGIGKTRLALQVAAEVLPHFEDGCWLVDLVEIADPQLVMQAICAAARVRERAGEPLLDTLVAHLRHARTLLLLDNCEHVLGAVAKLVREVASRCPHVSFLLTSREPSHLAGEYVYRLGPLPQSEAVQLFEQRAQATTGVQLLEAHHATAVGEICRRVEGIPLALEFAAARTGSLSPSALAERLESGIRLLATKDLSADERHRTLNATIAWSYRLLDAQEQRAFVGLSVFSGGFTLDQCRAVVIDDSFTSETEELIDSLVDKSFVVAVSGSLPLSYRILEPVRIFASECIDAATLEKLRERHFEYFDALVRVEHAFASPAEERAWHDRVGAAMPNIRAALGWALSKRRKDRALALLAHVNPYWQQGGHLTEARSWFARALADVDGCDKRLIGATFRRAATLATIQDDYESARTLTLQALAAYRELDDVSGIAEALHNLAVIEQRAGRLDEAYALFEEALQGFTKVGHAHGMRVALGNCGMILCTKGRLTEARDFLERAAEYSRSSGDYDGLASVLLRLADVTLMEGRYEDAQRAYTDALARKRDLSSSTDVGDALCALAILSLRSGDVESSEAYAREAVEVALYSEAQSEAIVAFEVFACVYEAKGQLDRAHDLVALTTNMRSHLGYASPLLPLLEERLRDLRGSACVVEREPSYARFAPDWRAVAEELLRKQSATAM